MIVPGLRTKGSQTAKSTADNRHVAPGRTSSNTTPTGNGLRDDPISAAC